MAGRGIDLFNHFGYILNSKILARTECMSVSGNKLLSPLARRSLHIASVVTTFVFLSCIVFIPLFAVYILILYFIGVKTENALIHAIPVMIISGAIVSKTFKISSPYM